MSGGSSPKPTGPNLGTGQDHKPRAKDERQPEATRGDSYPEISLDPSRRAKFRRQPEATRGDYGAAGSGPETAGPTPRCRITAL